MFFAALLQFFEVCRQFFKHSLLRSCHTISVRSRSILWLGLCNSLIIFFVSHSVADLLRCLTLETFGILKSSCWTQSLQCVQVLRLQNKPKWVLCIMTKHLQLNFFDVENIVSQNLQKQNIQLHLFEFSYPAVFFLERRLSPGTPSKQAIPFQSSSNCAAMNFNI